MPTKGHMLLNKPKRYQGGRRNSSFFFIFASVKYDIDIEMLRHGATWCIPIEPYMDRESNERYDIIWVPCADCFSPFLAIKEKNSENTHQCLLIGISGIVVKKGTDELMTKELTNGQRKYDLCTPNKEVWFKVFPELRPFGILDGFRNIYDGSIIRYGFTEDDYKVIREYFIELCLNAYLMPEVTEKQVKFLLNQALYGKVETGNVK